MEQSRFHKLAAKEAVRTVLYCYRHIAALPRYAAGAQLSGVTVPSAPSMPPIPPETSTSR